MSQIQFVISVEYPDCEGVTEIDGQLLKVGGTSMLLASMSASSTLGICNPHVDPSKLPKTTFKSRVFSVFPNKDGYEVRILVPSNMSIVVVH